MSEQGDIVKGFDCRIRHRPSIHAELIMFCGLLPQRVMMQIVQELCKRPGLNKCGFDMPTIYIPNPNKPSRCVNQIEEVCRAVEKTINQTVQNTLNSLEKDCEVISEAITDTLYNDRQTSIQNRRARCKSCFLTLLGFSIPFALMALLLLGTLSQELLEMALGHQGTEALSLYLTPVVRVFDSLSGEQQLYGCGGLVLLSFLLLLIGRFAFKTTQTLSGKQKRQLQEKLEYVQEVAKTKKKKLYEEYLRQSVSDHDMGL